MDLVTLSECCECSSSSYSRWMRDSVICFSSCRSWWLGDGSIYDLLRIFGVGGIMT